MHGLCGVQQGGMAEQGPNATLYVSNLPDNLKKDVLKASLKAIVSAVAPPLDIVVMSTMRLRCCRPPHLRPAPLRSISTCFVPSGTEIARKRCEVSGPPGRCTISWATTASPQRRDLSQPLRTSLADASRITGQAEAKHNTLRN